MIRRLAGAAAMAVVATLLVVPSPAQARFCLPDHTCDTQWFSDPEKTNQVGGRREWCDGSMSTWGVRGPYTIFVETRCAPGQDW